jgi:hypothetical protein
MKKSNLIIPSIIFCISVAWATSVFMTFDAKSEGDYAYLEWRSDNEQGLASYQVERSFDGLQFSSIAVIQPLGNNSNYVFEDHNLLSSSNRTYYYRLNALMQNGDNVLSPVKSVTLSFSGIQQTWGSIKALFR